MKNTLNSYKCPENDNTLCTLLHYATRTNDHIYRWTNQKHLKSPKCKLCEKTENIKHLFIDCKRNRKIWTHFQKYYQNLIQKDYIPLQHILSISAVSLPRKTKKLVLTLTRTILTHIWKTRNRRQFDDVTWKYNIRRNANSDFSIVTMRRVAIIFFELGVVKNSTQKF